MSRRIDRILFLLLLSLALSGCVSKNRYQQQVNEADLLSRDVAQLQSEKTALSEQNAELETQLSDLNRRLIDALNQNSDLQRTLINSRAEQTRKTQSFSHQQSEAAEQIAQLQQGNEQLLHSITQLQREKVQLEQQLEREKIAREARLAKLKNTYDQLVGALENEIERGEITISNLEGKLSVNLLSQILFDSGSTEVKPEGRKLLSNLGDVIKQAPDRALSIEGHTDDVQISARLKERFPSNWELSTARATSIVHYLQDQVGISGDRLSATGFGEYRPVGDNDTEEGRAMNRRIQINLTPYTLPDFQPETEQE